MQICLSNSITLLTSSNHFFIHNKYIDGENIQRIWNSTIASYSLFKVFMRSLSSGVWMYRKNFDTWIKVEKLDLIEISIWNLYFFMVITISHHIIPYEIGYTLNEYIMILKKKNVHILIKCEFKAHSSGETKRKQGAFLTPKNLNINFVNAFNLLTFKTVLTRLKIKRLGYIFFCENCICRIFKVMKL